jgi:hypothetical protein
MTRHFHKINKDKAVLSALQGIWGFHPPPPPPMNVTKMANLVHLIIAPSSTLVAKFVCYCSIFALYKIHVSISKKLCSKKYDYAANPH